MISRPTLILDESKCRANIKMMVDKAEKLGTELRPHFKTHQSLEIGRWFKELGVKKITVSSVKMAEYFAQEWDDITIAFPVNILEIEKLNDLASKIKLNVLLENLESTKFLSENAQSNLNVFIKVDVGYHRTGIDPANSDLINTILEIVDASDNLKFEGFLAHSGHTYKCKKKDDIIAINDKSVKIMNDLKLHYKTQYPQIICSLGDTPSCSVADNFKGIDEIRPGNFVLYDLMQHQIGSCSISQISVAVACPIVAIHKERNEMIIHGGGVHFSKDRIEDVDGITFGRPAENLGKGWGGVFDGIKVKSLSQEHGIISTTSDLINEYSIGDIVYVLPVHSCMVVDLMDEYLTTDGKTISIM